MSVLVLERVACMVGLGPQCVLLNLAKKLRSIVGHKECGEGSIVRPGPCEGQSGDQWRALSH